MGGEGRARNVDKVIEMWKDVTMVGLLKGGGGGG